MGRSTRTALWVGVTAVVLATLAGAAMSVATIGMAQELPRTLVARYLTALEHGKAEQAMRIAGIHRSAGDILLTDKVYAAATHRITSFTVGRPVTRSGRTTVEAVLTQGDQEQRRTFAFERTGGLPGVPLWRMAKVAPDTVSFEVQAPDGMTYSIAGIRPAKQALRTIVTLRALPGSYPMSFTSPNAAYRIWDADVASRPSGRPQTTRFPAQLSSDGDTAARAAVDAWLDACVATTVADPAGCPFVVDDTTDDGYTVSGVHWTLDDRPLVAVDSSWAHGGWMVSSDRGSIEASATVTSPSDGSTGQASTDPFEFEYFGFVTFGPGGAVFTPQLSDGSTQG
ncbi:hypothetical protein SAMN04515680_0724 [Leifsonia sp. 21MFCrub1.1]|nr:hypothetical protein SAMN04515680_0724 [Leifsonia sp. 21MFCrub1.1]